MPITTTQQTITGETGNCPVFDIVSSPTDLIKFRSALRAWFMSYLTQTDEHLNRSSLSENIWFYEAIQEWLDMPSDEFATTSTAH